MHVMSIISTVFCITVDCLAMNLQTIAQHAFGIVRTVATIEDKFIDNSKEFRN